MNDEIRQASDLARDPTSVSAATYFWVLFLATWGGIVRVTREVKFGGKTWKEVLFIFFAEMAVSSFAGVVTFFLCESANMERFYTAVLTSLAGYMGGRALNMLEGIYSLYKLARTLPPAKAPEE